MRGTLHKTEWGWMVSRCVGDGVKEVWEEQLPLHPYDVKQIEQDALVFDNIEARIAAYPDVEFEIVKENVDTGALEAPYIRVKYAKLKQEKISD